MNESQTISVATSKDAVEDGFDFLECLVIFAKHKKLIIGLPLAVAIAAGAISMTLPNVYRASAKILPPEQAQSGATALLSQLNGMAGAVASGAAGIKNPNDLYLGMLKSRRISDKLIEKYKLSSVYETASLEKTRKILEDNTTIISGKDSFISIEVEDTDKKRVAQIANSYVEELLNLTQVFAVTEASQRRMFFGRQLEAAKNNLAKAEITLKGALDTHGVISVDSDSRAIVETVSRLRAQIAAKEIQISAMQAFVTPNHQDFKRAREELSGLRLEFSKLQNGRPAADATPDERAGNQSGLENIKLLRDVKYHQMLYELLAKQFEVARLDESKETSVIQVLDGAVEPEKKYKPKRFLIVAFATILAFFCTAGGVFLYEMKEKSLKMPERAAQWQKIKAYLRRR